jgi:hypothetical protein
LEIPRLFRLPFTTKMFNDLLLRLAFLILHANHPCHLLDVDATILNSRDNILHGVAQRGSHTHHAKECRPRGQSKSAVSAFGIEHAGLLRQFKKIAARTCWRERGGKTALVRAIQLIGSEGAGRIPKKSSGHDVASDVEFGRTAISPHIVSSVTSLIQIRAA